MQGREPATLKRFSFQVQSSAWMDTVHFNHWFETDFVPFVQEKAGPEKWSRDDYFVYLVMDNFAGE
jgi:hypothetical protein